jgi:hypothetical protein
VNISADLSDGIYIYNFDTGETMRLPNTEPGDRDPHWEPIPQG